VQKALEGNAAVASKLSAITEATIPHTNLKDRQRLQSSSVDSPRIYALPTAGAEPMQQLPSLFGINPALAAAIFSASRALATPERGKAIAA